MRESKRRFRTNSSGQLLLVAALTIAILISSTTIYIYELSKKPNNIRSYPTNDTILALKQSTKNTVVSSLANISKGGDTTILEANLDTLSQACRNLHELGMYHLSFTVLNDSIYNSGVYLSWDKNDSGVSSAYTNFTLTIQGLMSNTAVDYAVNVTTTVTINGSYVSLAGEEKLVNLTCQVFNEQKPALTQNITLFYEKIDTWTPVKSSNNLSITDYGNGTYLLSFMVSTSSDVVQVSAHVCDLRDVFVQANTTCTEA